MANETVLITGASSGIGMHFAELFAADGAELVLVARSAERLRQLALTYEERYGARVRVLPADLSRPGAPGEIRDTLRAEGVEVDVLVNNAGFGLRGRVAELGVERQMDLVQLNVAALTHLTALFLPAMLERGRGGVLNVASTAAFQAGPNMAAYYASKAYVLSFTEALAEEVAGTGVRASCLAPGPTQTGFEAAAGMQGTRLFRMGVMDAAEVARVGYRGFRAGRVVVVPGWRNKLTTLSVRFVPRSFARRVAHYLQA